MHDAGAAHADEGPPGAVRVGAFARGMPSAADLCRLDVAEIQSTFDRPPTVAVARGWCAAAPDGFEFAVRAHRAVTHPPGSGARRAARAAATNSARCGHFRDTPEVRRAWKGTAEIAAALDASFVVFECPPTFGPTDEHLAHLVRFFDWAHRGRLRFAWEPRSPAWTDDLVGRLCRELSLTHAVDPLARAPQRGRPPYFRLRGPGRRRHRHSDEELSRLRTLCTTPRPMCTPGAAYCVFGNATRIDDARRFRAQRVASGTLPHRAPGAPLWEHDRCQSRCSKPDRRRDAFS